MRRLIIVPVIMLICIYVAKPVGFNVIKKTSSPYFEIRGGGTTESLPLLETMADVNIAGVIADVTIKQVYKNSGSEPIEAIYIFPASTQAAVHGMTMKVDDRLIVAKIKEKEKARKIYEKAKQQGKSASLLEQKRPNVFSMSVANIMPGDTITVELKYTELLIPEDGIYEFVYPTVAGPRYMNETGRGYQNPKYADPLDAPPYKFGLKVKLMTGVNLGNILSTSHLININKRSESVADITLDKSEYNGGNRDFILKYKLIGDEIQTGLIRGTGNDENYFLMMIQPPKTTLKQQIPPRDYIFIVDVSGSMHGFPLSVSKKLVSELLQGLRPYDRFNIMFFAGGSELFESKSVVATKDNIKEALRFLSNASSGGGTQLLPALKEALDLERDRDYSTSYVIVTDGYVSVEDECFDLIRDNLENANVFAFGIGSSVNRFIIEGLARSGNGEPFVVTDQTEAYKTADKFRKYIQSPVLTNIRVDFEGMDVYDVEPRTVPDVFADRPVIMYGKCKNFKNGKVTLKGVNGSGVLQATIPVMEVGTNDTSEAIKYLWARNKLFELADYAGVNGRNTYKEEITDIGLKYNLLTDFTSFVAVDKLRRNHNGEYVSVEQPVPVPRGVDPVTSGAIVSYGSGGGYGRYGFGGDSDDNPLCFSMKSTRIFLGPKFGYNSVSISDMQASSHELLKGIENFNSGGNGYYLGLFYEYHIGGDVNSKHTISASVNYSSFTSSYKGTLNDYNFVDADGIQSEENAGYYNEVSLSNMDFGIMWDFNVAGGFGIGIGPELSFNLSNNQVEKISLLSNEADIKFSPEKYELKFSDGNKTAVFHDGEMDEVSQMDLSMLFKLKYEILLGSGFDLIPELLYRWNLHRSVKNLWKYNNFYLGLGMRFAI